MFRCYFCQKITPPKTTRHTVVIETREKQYSTRRREPKRGGFRNREEPLQDRGGSGVEIIKEVDACPTCAAMQHEVKNIPATPPPAPATAESETATTDAAATETATTDAAATETAASGTAT